MRQQEEEKYAGVMVENPSAELKRDVVKLNNVCNIYARGRLTRVRRREEPCSVYLHGNTNATRRGASIRGCARLGFQAKYAVAIINGRRANNLRAPVFCCTRAAVMIYSSGSMKRYRE